MELTLEIQTPVHIGCGNTLIPNLDIVFKDEKAYILDFEKLPVDLKLNYRELMKKINLEKCSKYSIPIKAEVNNVKEVLEHIKIGREFSIPGSTVKGLVRTAILYSYFKNKDRDALLRKVEDKLKTLEQAIKSANKKEVAKGIKRFSDDIQSIFTVKVGKYTADVMQALMISDPIKQDIKASIRTLAIYELGKLDPTYFTCLETIDPGSKLQYRLSIKELKAKVTERSRINFIRACKEIVGCEEDKEKCNIKNIKRALMDFSINIIEFELERLNEFPDNLKPFCKHLKKFKSKVSESEFYLKIGFGTGQMSKTLNLLLYKYGKDLFDRLCNVMSYHYGRRWDLKTKKFDYYSVLNGNPMEFGWVKVIIHE